MCGFEDFIIRRTKTLYKQKKANISKTCKKWLSNKYHKFTNVLVIQQTNTWYNNCPCIGAGQA